MIPNFIFVHIPRTAGGTINHILRGMYPDKVVVLNRPTKETLLVYFPTPRYKIDSLDQIRHYPIITGHVPMSSIVEFKRPIITWLRHPVRRVISNFRWSYKNLKKRKGSTDIIEYARLNRNVMTEYTGGDLSKFSFVGITENFNKDLKRLAGFIGIDIPKYSNKHVSNKKIKVSEEVKKEIARINNKDMLLYNEARSAYGTS